MKPLGTNLEQLNSDFESATGKPFKHFYCPILHEDEDVSLSSGHVVPESLGGRTKVKQRSDVDNSFGSLFEAEAADAIRLGLDGNPLDVVDRCDPTEMKELSRRFELNLLIEGANKPVKAKPLKLGGEYGLYVRDQDLHESLGEDLGDEVHTGSIEVKLDSRSSILVTSLRASHLAWFRLCGYSYVFSNEGLIVASVLRSIYEEIIALRRKSGGKKGTLVSEEVKRKVNEYCLQFANFCRPVSESLIADMPDEIREGTAVTGWFIALWDGDQIYGRISVVRLGNQYAAILTPVVTDPRGWALIDLAANLELVFSFARFDAESDCFRIGPASGRAIWPTFDEQASNSPAINIRDAAQLVIDSGRMVPWPR